MVSFSLDGICLDVFRSGYPKRPKRDHHLELWATEYGDETVPQVKKHWLVASFVMATVPGQKFLNPQDVLKTAKELYLSTKDEPTKENQ